MSPSTSRLNVLSSDRRYRPACESLNEPLAIICSRSMSLSSFAPNHRSSAFSLRQKMNDITTGSSTSTTTAAVTGRHHGWL